MRLSGLAAGITVAAGFMFSTVDKAFASTACDAVNSGNFDRTAYTPPGSGVLNTLSGFEVGETLNFTVSGLSGSSFQLINGALNTALLDAPLSGTPQSVNYTVTGSNSDTTLNTYMLVQAIPYEITITATCTPVASSIESGTVAKAFLQSRINSLLMNAPSGTSLRNRNSANMRGGANNSLLALGFAGASDIDKGISGSHGIEQPFSGTISERGRVAAFDAGTRVVPGGNQSFHIRRSFSETIRNLNQTHEKAALGADTEDRNRAASTPSRFDVWGEAYYTGFDNDQTGSKRDGHSLIGYIGSDYRLSDSLLIGALVQLDSTKETSNALASRIEGEGWMAGPYFSAQLHHNIFLDLRAAAGRSSNDLNIANVTGSFDTVRWLVSGGLSGDWREGPWRFTPMADVAYIEEQQERFTDSSGTVVADQHVSLGRMTFGPEMGYSARVDDTVIEPYGSIKGVWNFDRSDSPVINGQSTGTGSFWGQLGVGVGVLMPANTALRVGLVYDGFGDSNYQSLTARGQLSIPLN